MNLAATITNRVEAGALHSPDTLHGLLFLVEQRADEAALAKLTGTTRSQLAELLTTARAGDAGRVPPVNARHHIERGERLPGLLPRLWQRAVVALVLRPDGATSTEVAGALEEFGRFQSCADAMSTLRAELRDLGVKIESAPVGDGFYRYRIIGRHNSRLQKIIANGWAL